MKIVQILSGPFEMGSFVWNLCLVKEGDAVWEEEIYYDSIGDALADFDDLQEVGAIDFYDDEYLDEEEEELINEW